MTILGLPVSTFVAFFIPVGVIAFTGVCMLFGWYEGRKVEKEYGVKEWYRTF